MSVAVELDRLREEVARFGGSPYLLTVDDEGRPHATVVGATLDGARFRAGVGRQSATFAGARPSVSLLWPPVEPGGFSLIVDGTATVDGEEVLVTASRAILHRRRADGPGSDCVKLGD